MSNTNFEVILAQEPLIEDLINSNHVNVFSKYPDCPEYSKEFLDWISPQYFESFKNIFKESTEGNKAGKLNAFLKTPSYCNTETKEEIANFLLEYIRQNNKVNKAHLANLNKKALNINEINNVGGFRIVTSTTVVIINNLSHPDIGILKSHTLILASKVLESLTMISSSDITKTLIRQNLEQINKLRLNSIQKKDFPDLSKLESSESSDFDKRILWFAISIIIIVLKLTLRLN